ncbi:MAG: ATPase, T2SS/T4P/T4SS family [bacterium]
MPVRVSLEKKLLESGLITEQKINEAQQASERDGDTLIKAIIKMKLLDDETLSSFLSDHLGIPRMDLTNYLIDSQIIELIPEVIAKRQHVIPLFKIGNTLTLAMADPTDINTIDEVHRLTNLDVDPMISTASEIDQAVTQYFGIRGSMSNILKDMGASEAIQVKEKIPEEISSLELAEGSPVAQLVSLLIEKAVFDRASDIHIEMEENRSRVRYRIDGLLAEVESPPSYLHPIIVSRIKVLAKMDIAENRVPQEGRFQRRVEGREIDIRVSTFPTINGEKVVMRLLDASSILIGLDQLGMGEHNLNLYEDIILRPYGIILVTGPTGSGKTTTLYSSLHTIASVEKNIVTVEDPVEYRLNMINQSQVNIKAGLTFANALRSLLRQDPDVVMIGEVRDEETARLAIQASLTGHLVFSTLHTNDASGSLTRLVDMEIEPYLISSSVIAALAQRLVRVICPRCKIEFNPPVEILEKLELKEGEHKFYRGEGCKNCRQSGYQGRTGIYELLVIDAQMRDMVMKKSTSNQIKDAAIAAGMRTLRDDGLQKAMQGITTIDEVLRVTQLD